MSYSRKRRRGSKEIDYSPQPQLSWLPSSSEAEPQLDKALSTLYVEAHEADIVHGKQHVALMLEPPESGANTPQKGEKGSGLVKRTSNNELEGVCWLDRCVYYPKVYTSIQCHSSFPELWNGCAIQSCLLKL